MNNLEKELQDLLDKIKTRFHICARWIDEYGGSSSCEDVQIYLKEKEKYVDEDGWIRENQGNTWCCPECKSYRVPLNDKEGLMAWTIVHYQKCKWLPNSVKESIIKAQYY